MMFDLIRLIVPRRPVSEEVRKVLPVYFDILENKAVARFILARKIKAEYSTDWSDDELWNLHDKLMTQFYSKLASDEQYNNTTKNIKSVVRGHHRDGSGDGDDDKSYLSTLLDLKIELARRILRNCYFCERQCKVNRELKKRGYCKVGADAKIASEFVHWGEEAELIPSYTIFFAGCTFSCVYCQNWDISQSADNGIPIPPKDLAGLIKYRYRHDEVKNTNWVGGDPTSNLLYILEVINKLEVNIPQVWNSNMYLSLDAMKLLDGVIDLYLTDFKYGNDACAKRLSKVNNYWQVITRNHKLANKQTELIIRHLVLPKHLECCTIPIFDWLSAELDTTRVRLNVMDQYHPDYQVDDRYPELTRRLSAHEYAQALNYALKLNLTVGD